MIIVMKPKAADKNIKAVTQYIEANGLTAHLSQGEQVTIIGVVGDKSRLSTENIALLEDVDRIVPVTESYKLANLKFHPEPSVVKVGCTSIGPKTRTIMAGPCAVESNDQLMLIAEAVKKNGATILRGGAYKPRTSPYSFQGLEEEGLKYMKEAGKAFDLATICEVVSLEAIEAAVKYVDMIQIGARNMQNFDLLKQLGRTKRPILLKRGLNATYEEWIMSAEYIMASGNENVILCERGVRTFETYTRNTLDLQAIPVLKKMTHLPVVVDPSHAGGKWWLVDTMAKAALAAGTDGLMIEVHNNPDCALCDGGQSLKPEKYAVLLEQLRRIAPIVEKTW